MSVEILIGDCRERLRELPDESVHCVVTSPPYFGLRDYGTVTWTGGDPEHDHDRIPARGGRGGSGSPGKQTVDAFPSDLPAERCSCGAVRIDQQIGLEPTPAEFVVALVEVFDEVRRVLRDDGTVWLNLGDSYAGSGKGAWANKEGGQKEVYIPDPDSPQTRIAKTFDGIKSKDLIGIPWRVAFALQERGWYLRQDIVWAKPNPMPEPVEDRCTKAHEYVFLLTKRPRYFFDGQAIAEDSTCDRLRGQALHGDVASTNGNSGLARRESGGKRNKRSVWTVGSEGFGFEHCESCWTNYTAQEYRDLRSEPIIKDGEVTGRRVFCRCGVHDRWLSHFATFPPALIEPCILAGVPRECCSACGQPYERITERTPAKINRSGRTHSKGRTRSSGTQVQPATSRLVGFQPGCACAVESIPGTVLDPFGGAATTGLVADRLQRSAILLELNPHYASLARYRLDHDRGGGLLDIMEAVAI